VKKIVVKFVYDGEPDTETDIKIAEIAEKADMKWYAQGYNLITDRRDVCFDIEN